MSDAVRRSRAGISDPNRPTGSFLFLGPTGVGKTELAKALAEFLFDDEHAMVRIDMSEYSEKHSVARLVGAPPGYIGYEEGGQLTEAVRRRPYAVVLLDEVEKAHSEVFDILLQVLDDGRLTDGQGRTVDFRNVILILTSNLGSQFLADQTLDAETKRNAVMGVVRGAFKPEFLNRLDEVVLFEPLGTEELARIVEIGLRRLNARLADRRIAIEATPAAKEWLALTGFDPVYGARPLRRLIQTSIEDQLARRVLVRRDRRGRRRHLRRRRGQRRPGHRRRRSRSASESARSSALGPSAGLPCAECPRVREGAHRVLMVGFPSGRTTDHGDGTSRRPGSSSCACAVVSPLSPPPPPCVLTSVGLSGTARGHRAGGRRGTSSCRCCRSTTSTATSSRPAAPTQRSGDDHSTRATPRSAGRNTSPPSSPSCAPRRATPTPWRPVT